MATVPTSPIADFSPGAQPAWEVAMLFPVQGQWSEEEYLALTDSTNWLVELTDGRIEVLPMHSIAHQLIVRFLVDQLRAFVEPKRLGTVLFAPLRVWIRENVFREPDIVFKFAAKHAQSGMRYYEGADLVMEVVSQSPGSRERDYERKRRDYAEAGIAEYWIVDPQEQRITVLTLKDGAYREHSTGQPGEQVDSLLLSGLQVSVADVFAAADKQ